MIDTVLFDVGGTLITQTHNPQRRIGHARYILNRFQENGIVLDVEAEQLAEIIRTRSEEYKHHGETTLVELPSVGIWNDYILKDFNIGRDRLAPIAEELSFIHDYIRLDNRPRTGLLETVRELRDMGMKTGIITNTMSTTFADHIIREYGVQDYFPIIVKSCELGIRKPDRRIFDYAMNLIGSTRESTCYVGDTISRDVLGSRNAQLAMCIKITNKSTLHRDKAFANTDSPKADFDITELLEIPAIIRSYNGKAKEKA